MTVGEIMAMPEPVIRLRSTFALFEMRRILRERGNTAAHAERSDAIADELRRREALS